MHPHILFIHALTPIHVGNDVGLGAINLPTMREVHTGYPLIPGSSLKGVLRAEADEHMKPSVVPLFGPERGSDTDARGDLAFGDAQLLALPIRSLYGTFAWITCPFALIRLRRDLQLSGHQLAIPTLASHSIAHCTDDSCVVTDGQRPARAHLEDFSLTVERNSALKAIAAKIAVLAQVDSASAPGFFQQHLLCVHDDLFAHFARTALEVRARVKIDPDKGTAAASGPWTEEHIPAESLLCALVVGRRESPAKLGPLLAGELRLGGRGTLGLGRARATLSPIGK